MLAGRRAIALRCVRPVAALPALTFTGLCIVVTSKQDADRRTRCPLDADRFSTTVNDLNSQFAYRLVHGDDGRRKTPRGCSGAFWFIVIAAIFGILASLLH